LGGDEFPPFSGEEKDIYLRETGPAQQPFLDLVMNAGEVCFDPLSRDSDIDLFCYIEVPIQVEIDLSFLSKPEVQVTGDKEHTCHNEDDEEGDFNFQAGQFSKDFSRIERLLELPEKMENFRRKAITHSSPSEVRKEHDALG